MNQPFQYLSVCSGIEAASTAWKPLGWECQWVAEIEKFPSAVLAHHYPDVPNLGDVTKVDWEYIRATRPVNCIVFGSPCQSFSVAGKRLGLDDPRHRTTDDRDANQLVSLRDPDAELVADGRFIVPVVSGDELACCFEVDGHDP